MVDSKPRVSIGMPVYNEERFIRQALDSILSQSFQDFEIIIYDNASTDQTGDICLEYMAKDKRIRYYRSDTTIAGVANFNRVFQLCDAEYFFWASGHDLRHETFIKRCIEILDTDESIVLCYPLTRWLEPDNSLGEVFPDYIDTRGLDRLSAFQTVLWGTKAGCQIYGVMRSSALRRTHLSPLVIGPDRILLAELSLLGSIARVPEVLLFLRRAPEYMNPEKSLTKWLGPTSSKKSALYMHMRFLCAFERVICAHIENRPVKLIYSLSILMCFLTEYSWQLGWMRSRRKSFWEKVATSKTFVRVAIVMKRLLPVKLFGVLRAVWHLLIKVRQ